MAHEKFLENKKKFLEEKSDQPLLENLNNYMNKNLSDGGFKVDDDV